MSKKINESTFAKSEDGFKEILNGDMLNNAVDFVAYLKEGGWTDEWTYDIDVLQDFFYMGEMSCRVMVHKNENDPNGQFLIFCWQCEFDIYEPESFPVDESLKEFARNNVTKCFGCGGCDAPGVVHRTVFGIENDSLCCNVFHFYNPDSEKLENIKKLLELQKHIIADSKKK